LLASQLFGCLCRGFCIPVRV